MERSTRTAGAEGRYDVTLHRRGKVLVSQHSSADQARAFAAAVHDAANESHPPGIFAGRQEGVDTQDGHAVPDQIPVLLGKQLLFGAQDIVLHVTSLDQPTSRNVRGRQILYNG
jgi:hypothetical protein